MTPSAPPPAPAVAPWTGSGPSPLPPPRLDWQLDALRERLSPWLPGCRVQAVGGCGSTNTELLARGTSATAANGPPRPCLLVAERQTAGRGRQGRAWLSREPGASLAFSLALPLAPRDWGGLSLAVGVALADALDPPGPATAQGPGAAAPVPAAAPGRRGEPSCGAVAPPQDAAEPAAAPRLRVKWPNDLWLADAGSPGGGRKLGGVLIETAGQGPGPARWCVIGVGLNIAPQPLEGFALSHGYACWREVDPDAVAPAVLARVAPALAQAVAVFAREGFSPLQPRWRRRDLLRGRAVTLTSAAGGTGHGDAGGTGTPTQDGLHGIADGVDDDGALRLRTADGTTRRIVAGEVSVRPLAQSGDAG